MSLPTCPTCVYAKGICKKTGVEIRAFTGCTYHTPKPVTNADRIRVMSEEDLAEFLEMTPHCGKPPTYTTDGFCIDGGLRTKRQWLEWLRQEGE